MFRRVRGFVLTLAIAGFVLVPAMSVQAEDVPLDDCPAPAPSEPFVDPEEPLIVNASLGSGTADCDTDSTQALTLSVEELATILGEMGYTVVPTEDYDSVFEEYEFLYGKYHELYPQYSSQYDQLQTQRILVQWLQIGFIFAALVAIYALHALRRKQNYLK